MSLLLEFRHLEERDPRLMQRVTQVISHLLRRQFIHIDDRGAPSLLETLRQPVAVQLIEDWFDVAGYRLVLRESEGWAGILPDTERIVAPRMRIDETLVLLLLRRLWEEAVQDGEIQPHGSVLLTLNEAYAAYESVVARAGRAALRINEFRDVVRELERRTIVRLGALDDEAQDMELTIRAIVPVVAGDGFLAAIETLLQRPDLVEDDPDEEPSMSAGAGAP